MRYIALIYSDETGMESVTEEQWGQTMTAYNAFTEESRAAGVNLGGEALQPTTAATTVRVRDGKTMTTDGPFAETKEALGGYYIFDCPTLDDAICWAAKIPGALVGSIEVRPVMEF